MAKLFYVLIPRATAILVTLTGKPCINYFNIEVAFYSFLLINRFPCQLLHYTGNLFNNFTSGHFNYENISFLRGKGNKFPSG